MSRPRRQVLLGGARALLGGGLAGCGLSERPYTERRAWPLAALRPATAEPLSARRRGKTLLLRTVRAGPAVQARGLQTLQADGSVQTAFYDEWAATPAEAVEATLRAWLEASGLFVAIISPGSRAVADLVLEAELVALVADPAAGVARVGLSYVLLTQQGLATTVLRQSEPAATAPLASRAAADEARAMVAALAALCALVERQLAPFA